MDSDHSEIITRLLKNASALAPAERRAFLDAALGVAREPGSQLMVSVSIDGLATVAAGHGAWRLAGAAEALRAGRGFKMEPIDQALRDRTLEAVRAHLGDAGLATALAEGCALSVDEAVREALEADEE